MAYTHERPALESNTEIMMVVDLDGSLRHTDILHESALQSLRDKTISVPYPLF